MDTIGCSGPTTATGKLSMTLTRLSGAKSLRDPLVSQLLGEWVASSPLAKARWYGAT